MSNDAESKRIAKADAKAEKARKKAMRPWFKKKRFIIPAAIVVIAGISTAANSGGDSIEPQVAVSDTDDMQVESSTQSEETTPEVEAEEDDFGDETASQEQARKMADSYLSSMAFSRSGLIDQLEYEGFSTEDAEYGVDANSVDWMEQAAYSAESYLDSMAFSRSGLIDQLEYEGFSTEEATYGVDANPVDWMEQAALSAKSYLDSMPFSRSGLIEQLEYEGFSTEEAEYGVTQAGL